MGVVGENEGRVGFHQWVYAHAQLGHAPLAASPYVLGLLAPRQEEFVAVYVCHHVIQLLTGIAGQREREGGREGEGVRERE